MKVEGLQFGGGLILCMCKHTHAHAHKITTKMTLLIWETLGRERRSGRVCWRRMKLAFGCLLARLRAVNTQSEGAAAFRCTAESLMILLIPV